MILVLNKKEYIELGDCLLKAYRVTGASLYKVGEKLDYYTLAMTDKDILEEVTASIESIGGYVEQSELGFTVSLPDNMVAGYFNLTAQTVSDVVPFLAKCYNFGVKHSKLILKLVNYVKSMARYICTNPESKEFNNGIESLMEEGSAIEEKIKERFSARG